MYNAKLKRFRETIVAMEKQRVLHKLSVCICSPRYPACNAHAPYCHLWPGRLYSTLPHYLKDGAILEKKKLTGTQKVCFDFLYKFRNIFYSKKDVYWSSCKVPVILVRI